MINIIVIIAITLFKAFIDFFIFELIIIIVINVNIVIIIVIIIIIIFFVIIFEKSIFKFIAFDFNIKKRLIMNASFDKS